MTRLVRFLNVWFSRMQKNCSGKPQDSIPLYLNHLDFNIGWFLNLSVVRHQYSTVFNG